MNHATLTPDTLATTLARGLSINLEKLIRQQLQAHVDTIITDIARSAAEKATVAVESMHDVRGMGLVLRVAINGLEIKL